MRVSWTARRENQSILKEINTIFIGRTDADTEAPILQLHDEKSQLTGKDLMLGEAEGRRGWQRMRCLGAITN